MQFTTSYKMTLDVRIYYDGNKWYVIGVGLPDPSNEENSVWMHQSDPLWRVVKSELEADPCLDIRVRNECF